MRPKTRPMGTSALTVLAGMTLLAGCCSVNPPRQLAALNIKPTLFADLGPSISVPDGLALHSSGDLMMAVPNYINWEKLGSKLVRIDANRNVTDWFKDLPLHPTTGKVHPMGMEFGPDGNLYIADNQFFTSKDHASRLLRVVVKDGAPVKCETVVEGFKLANAVRWWGTDCYVSDTFFDLPDRKHQSGVFKIGLAEMNKDKPVKLDPLGRDKRIVARYTAKPDPWGLGETGDTAGADGVCFDNDGNMYCGNFGDGVISRTTFDKARNPVKQEVVIDDPSIVCCDGIFCDRRTNRIYITNSKNNSVHVYDVNGNILRLLWVNDEDDGATGLLDQPCEPIIRGDELIVVNFDMSFPGLKNQTNDTFNTISVFALPQELVTRGNLPCGCQTGACVCRKVNTLP